MKEYGGYLPFDIKAGNEYYCGKNVIALNCARNAIVYAVKDGEYKKIFIPFYMCETVRDTLRKYHIQFELYHLDKRLEPVEIQLGGDECILYPNYYGLFSEQKMQKIVRKYKNVILDNTQAFFSEPILSAYNVYSCRKFIGVSDGAYLIKSGIKHETYEADKSSHRVEYLFKSLEQGTNCAYSDSLKAEKDISNSPILEMSPLTHMFLQMVDYEAIKTKRKTNFDTMNNCFEEIGMEPIKRSDECVPMVYPFFCPNINIRQLLIMNHIYVPYWWQYLLQYSEISAFERKIINCVLPLPIDQRYNTKDIVELAKTIQILLRRV